MIHFDSDTYRATFAGEYIQLLPKEFALFRFLYEHAGRTFSREELLDAVWPLEMPGDRTVDDHIYRLRKKTAKWPHFLHVETIRGQGYKLIRHEPQRQNSPLLQDEQFTADVNRMLSKYHGLGMGAAMQLLSEHKTILSLPDDPYYDSYLHFIRGDFEWLLAAESISLSEKTAYAVYIHAIIQLEHNALHYFETFMAKGNDLSREWRNDLRLSMIFLYVIAGKLEKAQEMVDAVRKDIADLNSPSFTAIFLLNEMYLQLQKGRMETAALKLQECETLLARHPIQRERGAYLVAKSVFLYRQGDIPSARQTLDLGMETTRQTHFFPHLLSNLKTALLYLETVSDETYRLKFQRQWDRLAAEYRFGQLLVQTELLLKSRL